MDAGLVYVCKAKGFYMNSEKKNRIVSWQVRHSCRDAGQLCRRYVATQGQESNKGQTWGRMVANGRGGQGDTGREKR